jgi:uncharacterized iron-regulated protein
MIFFFGCASRPPKAPPVAKIKGVQGIFQIGQIVDLHKGKRLGFKAFIDKIAPQDLIFVGEIHNNAEHHIIQFQVLQALMEISGTVDLAMEFFRTPKQSILDSYMSGKITESEFLESVDWGRSWGYPFHLYRPLLTLARERGSRVLAINVPQELVRKVAKVGLTGLSVSERAKLPRKIDLTVRAHRKYVREAYLMHEREGIPNFQFFYEAQCVYEEVMARNIATYFKKAGRKHRKLIVFTGNGHIVYRFGIPNRVLERVPVSAVTIMPYALVEPSSIPSEIADFVWLTPNSRRPHESMRKKMNSTPKEAE